MAISQIVCRLCGACDISMRMAIGVAPRSWPLRMTASRSVLWPTNTPADEPGEVRQTNGLVAETASRVGFAARTKAWKAAGLVCGGTVAIPDRSPDRARIGHHSSDPQERERSGPS